jgi:hypothetical protein
MLHTVHKLTGACCPVPLCCAALLCCAVMLQMVRKGPIGSPAPAQAGKSPRKQSASKGAKPHQQQQQPQQQDGLVPVVCGDESALFDTAAFKVKLDDGSWVSASAFEKLAGMEHKRKWKTSLYVVTADGGQAQIGRWLEQQGFEGPPDKQRKRKRKRQQQEEEGEEGQQEDEHEEEEVQPQQKKRKVRNGHGCVFICSSN